MKNKNENNYVQYSSLFARSVVAFALDISYERDGVAFDPMKTGVPVSLTDTFQIQTVVDHTPSTAAYQLRSKSDYIQTLLMMDPNRSVVYETGDVAVIDTGWYVRPGASYLPQTYIKMSMEQIDSNISLSYIRPDGTVEEIVPNTKVTVVDYSKELSENVIIKLKLNNKAGFGTAMTQVRIITEWI